MRIKLTEQQFRRIMLMEQDTDLKIGGVPIEKIGKLGNLEGNVGIGNPPPGPSIKDEVMKTNKFKEMDAYLKKLFNENTLYDYFSNYYISH